jgi:hypothetical protein
MPKPIISYVLDALMGIVFFVCAVSAFLPREAWSEIHEVSGIILIVLVLLHLILHFKWIVVMTKSLFKSK